MSMSMSIDAALIVLQDRICLQISLRGGGQDIFSLKYIYFDCILPFVCVFVCVSVRILMSLVSLIGL